MGSFWIDRVRNEKNKYDFMFDFKSKISFKSKFYFSTNAVVLVYTCGNALCCVLLNFRDYHKTERQNKGVDYLS